jgi:hypothetical protein
MRQLVRLNFGSLGPKKKKRKKERKKERKKKVDQRVRPV